MPSALIITDVERLQQEIVNTTSDYNKVPGIFISFNKPQHSTEQMLTEAGVDCENIFFIDCVSNEKMRDDVLHIPARELDLLTAAIQEFIKVIPGQKYLLIDALSTLLIYNNENKVAQFVREITTQAAHHDVQTIAFSPKTRGEELLEKIFNFFDKVEER